MTKQDQHMSKPICASRVQAATWSREGYGPTPLNFDIEEGWD